MKNEIIGILMIVLILVCVALYMGISQGPQGPRENIELPPSPNSPKNATYRIDDREITLTDGYASIELATDSASRLETRIEGDPYIADLNEDGYTDSVLILTQNGGGSGTFYYVAVAFADGENAFQGSNALYLGDRIVVDNVTFADGVITVAYTSHSDEQAMTDEPDTKRNLYVTLSGATI